LTGKLRIGINFHSKTPFLSGVQYYAMGIIKALLTIDPVNSYIVFTNHPNLVRQYVGPAPNLTIRATSIKTRIHRIIWEHFRLPQLTVRESIDILHCPCYICPLFDGGTPYVVTIHDTIALDHPEWCTSSNTLYYRAFLKASARKAAAIIAVSQRTRDDIARHFPDYAHKIRVVYPGIDPAFLTDHVPDRIPSVRARYRLPDRYILYVGNLEPRKNLRALLDAFRKLRKVGFPQKLVIVGKATWGASDFFNAVAPDMHDGNVVLTGYVERQDLPTIYRLAEVFVFISLHEGFGFPPLEAMVSGTPVVSSSEGALNETLEHARFVTDPGNPDEIADAVANTLANPHSDPQKQRIRQATAAKFDPNASAQAIFAIYLQVLNDRAARMGGP